MYDNSKSWNASFSHLAVIYQLEQTSVIKQGNRLNYKCLHPHSIERLNVKLALRVFCDITVASLRTFGPSQEQLPNWEGTQFVIEIILKFWNIVNVKTPFKGKHKRLDDANPISDLNDNRITWMTEFVTWLYKWRQYSEANNTTFLTTETFEALSHTMNGMVYMIHDLLNNNILDYILLGKFQTDNLESRFGQYRQLSGCNYLVSVAEVMQSERKLRIKGLLKLHTKSGGDINVKTFLAKFSEVKKDKQDLNFISNFSFDDIDVTNSDELSALLMVTGYIAKKAMARMECIPCKQKFGSADLPIDLEVINGSLTYFNTINRGGLTYPSNVLFHTVQCAYNIFNICISKHEPAYLRVENQKQTLLGLFEMYITKTSYFNSELLTCTECGSEIITQVMRALSCFANILLENYSTTKSETVSKSNNSRKVSKF